MDPNPPFPRRASGRWHADRAPSDEPAGLRGLRLRFFAAVVLAVLLVWFVVSHSFAAYFASAAPSYALGINSSQPLALVRSAAKLVATSAERRPPQPEGIAQPDLIGGTPALDAQTLADVRRLAERALGTDPLNAAAMRLLADHASLVGDAGRERTWLEAAAGSSLHQSGAHFRLMLAGITHGEGDAALTHADILMRTRPDAMHTVMDVLAASLSSRPTRTALLAALATNPPWRRQFFARLPAHLDDARAPLDLYLGLKRTAVPPTVDEQRSYLEFLVAHDFHELAYYTWLQLLTSSRLAAVAPLFNGDFSEPASGLPFDWTLADGPGAIAEVVTARDEHGRRGLHVELGDGRVEFGSVSQWTVLAPGTYRLRGRMQGQIKGPRGLVWRIVCSADRNRPIAESPMLVGTYAQWTDFETPFTVPPIGCGAQQVHLTLAARSQSEKFVKGSAWYEGLTIERIAGLGQVKQSPAGRSLPSGDRRP